MKKILLILMVSSVYAPFIRAIPGTIIGCDSSTNIPMVSYDSLDVSNYEILKVFKAENLPASSNWQDHADYYAARNRTVYRAENYVVKIWQKNYASELNFLLALKVGFYEGIAHISALIFDDEGSCRGYITPHLIDREFNREVWESYGIKVEKGPIGVKVFASYASQPKIYKDLFDRILAKTKSTCFITYDFCPNNVAFDEAENCAYLIDLEDVQRIMDLNDPIISRILNSYCARDYAKLIHQFYEL